MCTLIEAINTFKENNRNIIDESKLVYDWNGWDDKSTSMLFHWFHVDLKYALDCGTEADVKKIIQRILNWGGINKIDDNTLNTYIGILNAFEQQIQWPNPPIRSTIISQDHPVGSQQQTHLPSWTKILAAYNPNSYSIYDARVAVALRIVCPDTKWFLPHSSATYNKTAKALIDYFKEQERQEQKQQQEQQQDQLSQRESYDEYLVLLRETGNPVKYERTLFMLVDAILRTRQNGAQYINVLMNDGRRMAFDLPQD